MAIGWMTVLKAVPWTEVISNAPKVAEGARKLWDTVYRKKTPPSKAGGNAALAAPAQDSGTAASRLAALEAGVDALHEQMLASSDLIKALADQNAQLVARVEGNRRKILQLTVFIAIGLLAALAFALLSWQSTAG